MVDDDGDPLIGALYEGQIPGATPCGFLKVKCGTGRQFCIPVAPGLKTAIEAQAWIYAFSIILPMLCFIFVTKWPGLKYYRSRDPKAKAIGINAIVLITLSTIVTIWLAYIWTMDAIQASVNSINADMSSLSI